MVVEEGLGQLWLTEPDTDCQILVIEQCKYCIVSLAVSSDLDREKDRQTDNLKCISD